MRLVLVVFALLALAPDAAAQTPPNPACRAVPEVHDIIVDLYRDLFYGESDGYGDSVNAQLRNHFGVRKLAPPEPVVPIRDVAVCEEWLPALLAAIRVDHPATSSTHGYLFEMIQYGPYMLVIGGIDLDTVPPGLSVAASPLDIFLFEVAGRRFLGRMLH